MLAVSYDNARQQNKEFDGKCEKEGSYISIFSNKAVHKTSKSGSNKDNLYVKYTDIKSPSM